ncbi:ent-kaurenoic acid oxidase 2-like [Prosopis cineraria]|uniref:ent-kaurenoic acid oxidase 2-like n=1 Tax=Prosopis cineraria TaxID=364024 RepID=UPI002410696C|nr:ent-kaurenoic acid oxidase 2-like [Prosopis cineraria]
MDLALHIKASNHLTYGLSQGYCVFLAKSLVSWSTRKQKVVARSSAELEYGAVSDLSSKLQALEHVLGSLRRFYQHLKYHEGVWGWFPIIFFEILEFEAKAIEMGPLLILVVAIFGGLAVLGWLLKNVNWWIYERPLGDKQYSLPPGDMGLPIIGNMWSFLLAFKSEHPDSYVASFVKKYGNTGIYKSLMFGFPSVIVTKPETCKKVLMDDEKFQPGWPASTEELMGKYSFIVLPYEEHKRIRRLTSTSINGMDALSFYLTIIEDIAKSSLETWSKMGEIELLTELRRFTFRIIMHIFLGPEREHVMHSLGKEYSALNLGVRAMKINLPGFAYHKARKAKKKLDAVFRSVVEQRRKERKEKVHRKFRDMIDDLMDAELDDEQITDIIVMYTNNGHESSGHTTMWATVYLQQYPEVFQKAKAEQEEIIRRRPATQTTLTLNEIRQMKYLSKVIDETFRLVTLSWMVFRVAKSDVNINGYLVPKGWKALVWFREIHFDPKIYPNPYEFNPSRWDNFTPKAFEFMPFGAGSRLCPGNDLAKMETIVFLHHFLLNYRLERLNPKSHVRYLPHPRPTDNCVAKIHKIS